MLTARQFSQLTSAIILSGIAQAAIPRPSAAANSPQASPAANSYKERLNNNIDPGSGGNPLDPPKGRDLELSDPAVSALCKELKQQGRNPEYCQ